MAEALKGCALFDAAVSAVLSSWPALKMAVSHQFGGPHSQDKATWMEGATAQWMRENSESPPWILSNPPYTCPVQMIYRAKSCRRS